MSRVALKIDAGIATIRLVAPDRRNAIDPQWVAELAAAVDGACAPGAARAVLVLADGAAFTVGGDLDHFGANTHRLADELRTMVEPFHRTLADLAEAPVPVVCGARGAAAGGGIGLLFAADVVIAGDDLKLATGFDRLGLTGDGGWSYYLPRLVGMRRAQELAIGGRVLDAMEAMEWGLLTRVVAAGDVDEVALEVARKLAAGPTLALGEMRRLLRESWGATVREQLVAELDAIVTAGATADAAEGISAFGQRRGPTFEAR